MTGKTFLENPKTDKVLTGLMWGVGGGLLLVLVCSAVSKKMGGQVTEVIATIMPLSDGSKMITEKDVLVTLTRSLGQSPKGMAISKLDLFRMEERILERDPFISAADVYLDARNRLHLDIQQRQPVLRIIEASGKNYYLDREGRYMPTSVNFTARVPVATGYIPAFTPEYMGKKSGTLKHLFLFAEKIRRDEFMSALTEQIFVTKNREFVVIPKVGKQHLLFGKNRDVGDKFRQLKIFYKEGIPYEGWQKYKSIDLRYDGQVVCKRG